MLINIADIKGKHNINLEEKTIQIAKEVGFQFVKKIHLSLSNLNLRDKEKKYKYEPIFVFIRK